MHQPLARGFRATTTIHLKKPNFSPYPSSIHNHGNHSNLQEHAILFLIPFTSDSNQLGEINKKLPNHKLRKTSQKFNSYHEIRQKLRPLRQSSNGWRAIKIKKPQARQDQQPPRPKTASDFHPNSTNNNT